MFEIPFFLKQSDYRDVKVGQTEKDLIYSDNKLKFYRYRPIKKNLRKTPFLIIYALINKNYILDLAPGISFVEYLLSHGYDTYIIDWGEPGDEDRFLELDYFINWYIDHAVKKVLELTGAEKLTMFGYCMGGHLATIYAALHNEYIKNLIVLATPIDTSRSVLVDLWTNKEKLDIDRLVDAFGNVPARMMQRIFSLVRDKMEKNYFGDISAQAAVAKWSNDNIDIAGEAFRKYVKECFQENLLCQNKLLIDGEKVQLNKIVSNLCVITGDDDWVAPYKATIALHELVSSENKETLMIEGGHLGFIVKQNSKKIWEKLHKWLMTVREKELPKAKSATELKKLVKKKPKKKTTKTKPKAQKKPKVTKEEKIEPVVKKTEEEHIGREINLEKESIKITEDIDKGSTKKTNNSTKSKTKKSDNKKEKQKIIAKEKTEKQSKTTNNSSKPEAKQNKTKKSSNNNPKTNNKKTTSKKSGVAKIIKTEKNSDKNK